MPTNPKNTKIGEYNPPKAKRDFGYLLNPRNWGVENYSNYSFNTAFEKAKKGGEDEFIWNGKRYNTKSNLSKGEQVKRYGITDDRKENTGYYSDRLYRTIKPDNYKSKAAIENKFKDFVSDYNRFDTTQSKPRGIEGDSLYKEYLKQQKGIFKRYEGQSMRTKEDIYHEQQDLFNKSTHLIDSSTPDDNQSEDGWRMYLGLPQVNNSFSISKYKPTISKDSNTEYYSLNNKELRTKLINLYNNNTDAFNKSKIINVGEVDIDGLDIDSDYKPTGRVLGNFAVSKGKDEKGEYLSYYDKYDLTPNTRFGRIPLEGKVGQPFEIYDRIYLNDDKQYKMGGKIKRYAWGDYYGNSSTQPINNGGITQINIGKPYFNTPDTSLNIPNYQQFKDTSYYYNASKLNSTNKSNGYSLPSLSLSGSNNSSNTSFAKSGTGQAIGAVAGMAASAINSNQNKGDVSQTVDAAAGAVPLWGQLVQLGRAIGGEVSASDPTDKYAQGLANAISPSASFTKALDEGDTEGAFIGLLAPGKGAELSADRAKKAEEIKRAREISRLRSESQGILADYPVNGIAKYGMKFPMGGKLPYPTQKDASYEVLSSDSIRYDGKTHAQGGIPLDTNMDGKPEIEVEDNEVIKDDMVYSDRINPSSEFTQYSASQGFKISDSESYASAMNKLGKKKGKFETNLNRAGAAGNTARLMTERLDNLSDILFEDQQMKKANFGDYTNQYASGGHLNFKSAGAYHNWLGYVHATGLAERTPGNQAVSIKGKSHNVQHAYGGYTGNDPRKKLPKDVVLAYSTTLGDNPLVKVDENDPLFYDKNQFINYYRNKTINSFNPENKAQYNDILKSGGPENADSYLALRGGLPNFDSYQKIVRDYEKTQITNPTTWPNLDYNGSSTGGYRYSAKGGKGLPAKGSVTVPGYARGGKYDEYMRDYSGDLISGLGFAATQSQIGKLETDYNPTTIARPQYTYTNRLPYLTNQIEGQFRAASKGLSQSSQQDNAALKANLYAKSLDAINESTDRELQRKDTYNTNYEQLALRTDMYNNQNINAAKIYGLENRNQRTALTQANIDNLIRSYQGNQAMRGARQLDADKAYLSVLGDYTGAGRRFYNQLPENLRRRYNWNFSE